MPIFAKIQLVIEDNGAGISEASIGKLFKDYSRLEEHENMNAKGTGLGLSICKNIIEQMGGGVEVESQLGKGTKFKITINVKALEKKPKSILDSDMERLQMLEELGVFKYTDFFGSLFEETPIRNYGNFISEYTFKSIQD